MKLAMVLEGPLAFDGNSYYIGKGEGLYVESLSRFFREVIICAYVLDKNHPDYSASKQHKLNKVNVTVLKWPHYNPPFFKTIAKFIQLTMLAFILLKNIFRWDVTYIFFPGYPAAIASIFGKIFNRKYTVYLASDWQEEAEFLIPWKGNFGKFLLPIFKRSISWSQNLAVRGAKFTLVAGRLLVEKYKVYDCIVKEIIPRLNWEHITVISEQDKFNKNEINILTVSSLIPRKGTIYIIDALNLIKQNNDKKIFLHVVGEGFDKEQLESYTQELGIEKEVIFHGQLPHDEKLMTLYRNADVFVLGSLSGEGFPRVLYEAMSQGVPIIAPNICGIPLKMPNNERAIIVAPGNANEIRDGFNLILNDINIRTRLIKNNLAFMEKLLANNDNGRQFYDLLTTSL